MRYFLTTPVENSENIFTTQIKDLREGLGSKSQEASHEIPPDDLEFLHKYMTLTRCDLLFADKAVLIEGTTERLLLPKMTEKLDAENPGSNQLSSQYISVVEVGGAYAHRFFKLLEFLELRTLIITDLDSTKKSNGNKLIACKVSEGTHTSNACIKNWFGGSNITPADLIQKTDKDKTCSIRRLAYQVPETNDAPCGRSFEDAFILANMDLFELNGDSQEEKEKEAWEKAKGVKKSDFALEYAIEKTEWAVPRYIAEGLRWLSEGVRDSGGANTQSISAPAVETEKPPKVEESND